MKFISWPRPCFFLFQLVPETEMIMITKQTGKTPAQTALRNTPSAPHWAYSGNQVFSQVSRVIARSDKFRRALEVQNSLQSTYLMLFFVMNSNMNSNLLI